MTPASRIGIGPERQPSFSDFGFHSVVGVLFTTRCPLHRERPVSTAEPALDHHCQPGKIGPRLGRCSASRGLYVANGNPLARPRRAKVHRSTDRWVRDDVTEAR